MDLGLKDKVVVVTGASRGIGRSVATAFAKEGAHVVCVATTEAGAEETAAACRAHGVRSIGLACDVADFAAVEALAGRVQKEFDGCDVLVNNAGITRDTLVLRMKEDDWDRVLAVNLKGTFNCCRHFAKTLMKRGGRVVNMTSIVGIDGNAGQVNYAASKGGVIALTKSLAKELASRQVGVNAIAPGFIETDMTHAIGADMRQKMIETIPLQRLGTGDDIAQTCLFLSGKVASYITGQVFVVDGGMSV